jgi:hypothetical protein
MPCWRSALSSLLLAGWGRRERGSKRGRNWAQGRDRCEGARAGKDLTLFGFRLNMYCWGPAPVSDCRAVQYSAGGDYYQAVPIRGSPQRHDSLPSQQYDVFPRYSDASLYFLGHRRTDHPYRSPGAHRPMIAPTPTGQGQGPTCAIRRALSKCLCFHIK